MKKALTEELKGILTPKSAYITIGEWVDDFSWQLESFMVSILRYQQYRDNRTWKERIDPSNKPLRYVEWAVLYGSSALHDYIERHMKLNVQIAINDTSRVKRYFQHNGIEYDEVSWLNRLEALNNKPEDGDPRED